MLLVIAVSAGGLGACGGGGGGSSPAPAPAPTPTPTPQAQFSVSPTVLNFSAAEPKSAVPAAQQVDGTVTGTVTGTTLYILVTVAGSNIVDTISPPSISGNTGSVLVAPVAPMSLGTGGSSATLTVRACMDSATCASGELPGSPRTIAVTYAVGSAVQADLVMPHVVDRLAAGTVVLRGSGFAGVTSVSFGSSLGNDVTVRSSTEISVKYPPMTAAGTYAVTLNGGAVPFTGSLVAVDPPSFAHAKLGYPAGDAPVDIPALVYDAERRALFVGERYADRTDPSHLLDHRILRYAFAGATWGTPTISPNDAFRLTAQLRDLAMSPRGDRLLVLREGDLMELDPVSFAFLAQGVNLDLQVNGPSLEFMRFIAPMNDGYALISDGSYGGGSSGSLALYSLKTRTFTRLNVRVGSQLAGTTEFIDNVGSGVVAASGDGSLGLVASGSRHFQYKTGNGLLSKASALAFTHANDYRPAIDTTGAHIVIGNGTDTSVYAGDYTLLCRLPAGVRAYTIGPAGNRAFALSAASKLQAYSTASANGGPCVTDGPEIDVEDPGIDPPPADFFPLSNVQMTISPDGATLFMAGVNHVVVQPWPPGP